MDYTIFVQAETDYRAERIRRGMARRRPRRTRHPFLRRPAERTQPDA
ncbi:hypothetical protein [Nocardioides sp. cx-173]|nr:hypothetical protein [Nocardioides sp. cx-173]MCD4524297.1 hypothetical protein [Nocardioides sp. cx-173]UGB41689.1 hypothetical protein LQ940_20320 [Nocardioides sp. cx-173]